MRTDPTIFSAHIAMHPKWPYTIDFTSSPRVDDEPLCHLTIKSGDDMNVAIVGTLDDLRAFVTDLAVTVGEHVSPGAFDAEVLARYRQKRSA